MRFLSRTLATATAAAIAAVALATVPALAGTGMPTPWQMNLQGAATPVSDYIHWFHDWLNIIIFAVTLFVLAGNTLLRPLVNLINRIPINDRTTEATYEVSVMSSRDAMPEMRDLLVERLEQANYPVSNVEITDRSDDMVEIVATLVSTAVDPHEIEAVTTFLEKQAGVTNASWDGSTKD